MGMTACINKEIDDVMKIVECLEESSLLVEHVSKTIKNEAKEQKGGFLSMNSKC